MDYTTKRRYSRIVSMALYTALLAYLILTTLNHPLIANAWIVIGIKTLPLLLFLPGMIKQHLLSMTWLSFLLLIYFIFAVPATNTSDWTLAMLISTLFIAVLLHIRWHSRARSDN